MNKIPSLAMLVRYGDTPAKSYCSYPIEFHPISSAIIKMMLGLLEDDDLIETSISLEGDTSVATSSGEKVFTETNRDIVIAHTTRNGVHKDQFFFSCWLSISVYGAFMLQINSQMLLFHK